MIVIVKHTSKEIETIGNFTRVLNENNATLLDGSLLPALARVKVDGACVGELKSGLGKSWEVYPETTFKVPTTQKTPRKKTKAQSGIKKHSL